MSKLWFTVGVGLAHCIVTLVMMLFQRRGNAESRLKHIYETTTGILDP